MTAPVRLKRLLDEVDDRAGEQAANLPLLSVSITTGVRRRDASATTRAAAEDLSNYKICATGDLVINRMRAFQGALGIAPEEGVVSPDYSVLRVSPMIERRWLGYYLTSTSTVAEMASLVRGIGGTEAGNVRTPRLNVSDLQSMRVDVGSLKSQRAIADYLDRETGRIDELIEEQRRLIDLLRERRGSVADRLLGRDADVCPLKRVVNEVTVGIVVNPAAWYEEDGVPALRGLNVRPGCVNPADLVYLSAEGDALHQKSRLRAGDVVVVRTGQAGSAAVVPPYLEGANAIDLLIIRPGPKVDSDFLAAYLNAPSTRSRITKGSVGAIQGHFNVAALRELTVPAFDLTEQRDCVARWLDQARAIDTLIAETERFIELSRERRSALITAAVTGQLDVCDEVA